TTLAQVALFFGADDLVGTVVDETITHAAGATTASGMSRTEFESLIGESGREPFERDAEYRRVVRGPGSGSVPRELSPGVSLPVCPDPVPPPSSSSSPPPFPPPPGRRDTA